MAKIQDNIRSFAGEESGVFLAPKGTTLPTDLTTIPAAFVEVGWISDSGIEEELSVETKKTKGWQGGRVVKVRNTSTERTGKFSALEESPFVTGLYYAHEAPVVTGTGAAKVAKVELPGSIPVIEKAVIIKYVDESGYIRLDCCDLIQFTERGSTTYNVEDDVVREFSFEFVGDRFWLTNEPAFTETP